MDQSCGVIETGTPIIEDLGAWPEYTDFLKARIAALEDCLAELVPFAEVFEFDIVATMRAASEEEAAAKGCIFKRDTLHLDHQVFRKAKALMKHRV